MDYEVMSFKGYELRGYVAVRYKINEVMKS